MARTTGSKVYVDSNGTTRAFIPGTEPAGFVLKSGNPSAPAVVNGNTPANGNTPRAVARPAVPAIPAIETTGNVVIIPYRNVSLGIAFGAAVIQDECPASGFATIAPGVHVFVGTDSTPSVAMDRQALIGRIEACLDTRIMSDGDIEAQIMAEYDRKRDEAVKAAIAARKARFDKAPTPDAPVNAGAETITW